MAEGKQGASGGPAGDGTTGGEPGRPSTPGPGDRSGLPTWLSRGKPTILCADRADEDRTFLEEFLGRQGYEVLASATGAEVIELVREKPEIDLLLIDSELADMDGLEVCEAIRSFPLSRYIPIILATPRPTLAERDPDPNTGADDYVSRPYLRRELLARIQTLLRVKLLEDEILRLTSTDLLTGLNNRRYLTRRLEEEISRARRYHTALSCFLVDIDRFRGVNEAFGHRFGDEALLTLGQIISRHVRREDVIGTWGGEEFFAILPESNETGAYVLAERIRAEVDVNWFEFEEHSTHLTISIGVAGYAELPTEIGVDRLIKDAELALQSAKDQKGNRVCVYSTVSGA